MLFRILPESSSWLLSQGRISEAQTQLTKIARINGHKDAEELVADLISKAEEETEKEMDRINEKVTNNDAEDEEIKASRSILALLQFPKLRNNVLLVLLVW